MNDVQLAYNAFGQLTSDFQEHGGAVNLSTTPEVAYVYADGSANTIRPTTMTYPNGHAPGPNPRVFCTPQRVARAGRRLTRAADKRGIFNGLISTNPVIFQIQRVSPIAEVAA